MAAAHFSGGGGPPGPAPPAQLYAPAYGQPWQQQQQFAPFLQLSPGPAGLLPVPPSVIQEHLSCLRVHHQAVASMVAAWELVLGSPGMHGMPQLPAQLMTENGQLRSWAQAASAVQQQQQQQQSLQQQLAQQQMYQQYCQQQQAMHQQVMQQQALFQQQQPMMQLPQPQPQPLEQRQPPQEQPEPEEQRGGAAPLGAEVAPGEGSELEQRQAADRSSP